MPIFFPKKCLIPQLVGLFGACVLTQALAQQFLAIATPRFSGLTTGAVK